MEWQYVVLLCLVSSIQAENGINDRLDCLLTGASIDQAECQKRGCIFDSFNSPRVPWCYLNTSKVGYNLKEPATQRVSGLDATLVVNSAAGKSLPFAPIETLQLTVTYLAENILRIRITDPAHKRYEVPVQFTDFTIPSGTPTRTSYKVSVSGHFNFSVTRKSTGAKIIDTSIGGLIYSDKFIQFATHLASSNVYGIGEGYHPSFKHDMAYRTYPLFSRDRGVGETERNNYGVQPYFTVVEEDGKAHGVLLINSNAMAYTMLPTPAIAIKTFGGILDFLIFVGDNPEHVTQLYTSVIGRPVMPPFWGLGFQLCRYGYKDLNQLKRVVQRNLDSKMPIDVNYLDIDYMDEYRDFTYDKVHFNGLPEYINQTKRDYGFRWTFIVDPSIQGDLEKCHAFSEGYKRDVFIKWPASVPPSQRTKPGNAPTDKSVMYGHVWPKGPNAFPDFFRKNTTAWWTDMLKEFHQVLNYDAIWTDMNEPSNFASEFLKCPDDEFELTLPSQNFPDKLSTNTICMCAVQGDNGEYRHFDVHSLYGWSEAKPSLLGIQAATGKRGFVVTRSTYPSSGKYTAHWLGDNKSNWEQLRQSIIGMLEFSLFGISYTGADICGFDERATPELCRRWYQLGAFYPFSRTHNADKQDQDPAYWAEKEVGHPEVTHSAVAAYRTRYQLLHYLYTRFYRSHVHGETLVRPVHHEFPQDAAARSIDEQFFLGPSIMVNPFLYEHQTAVHAYVPGGSEWYSMSHDFVEKAHASSGHVVIPDSESHRPLLIRAGTILPVVSDQNLPKLLNTANLRQVPIELWLLPSSNQSAYGDLFYDDGESIDTVEKGDYNFYQFHLDHCHLTITATHSGYRALRSDDILQIQRILVALPDTHNINSTNVKATLNNNQTLTSTIISQPYKALKLEFPEGHLDLLQDKHSFSISFTNRITNECFTH